MHTLYLVCLIVLCGCAEPTETPTAPTDVATTTIYLTRHAEKATGEDPPLLPAGKERARALADKLADRNITAIYATPYRRTRATAQPLADRLGLTIQEYAADGNFDDRVADWQDQHQGETILVVGHSNTVPYLVNALLKKDRYGEIGEEEYGQLFRVVRRQGSTKVKVLNIKK